MQGFQTDYHLLDNGNELPLIYVILATFYYKQTSYRPYFGKKSVMML